MVPNFYDVIAISKLIFDCKIGFGKIMEVCQYGNMIIWNYGNGTIWLGLMRRYEKNQNHHNQCKKMKICGKVEGGLILLSAYWPSGHHREDESDDCHHILIILSSVIIIRLSSRAGSSIWSRSSPGWSFMHLTTLEVHCWPPTTFFWDHPVHHLRSSTSSPPPQITTIILIITTHSLDPWTHSCICPNW